MAAVTGTISVITGIWYKKPGARYFSALLFFCRQSILLYSFQAGQTAYIQVIKIFVGFPAGSCIIR